VIVAFINLAFMKPNEKEQIEKKHEIDLLHLNDVSFGYRDHGGPICKEEQNLLTIFCIVG
jgi:hypothetical protein